MHKKANVFRRMYRPRLCSTMAYNQTREHYSAELVGRANAQLNCVRPVPPVRVSSCWRNACVYSPKRTSDRLVAGYGRNVKTTPVHNSDDTQLAIQLYMYQYLFRTEDHTGNNKRGDLIGLVFLEQKLSSRHAKGHFRPMIVVPAKYHWNRFSIDVGNQC